MHQNELRKLHKFYSLSLSLFNIQNSTTFKTLYIAYHITVILTHSILLHSGGLPGHPARESTHVYVTGKANGVMLD